MTARNAFEALATAALQGTGNGILSDLLAKLAAGTTIGRVETNNVSTILNDNFETFTPGTKWNVTLGTGDLVVLDGNTAGASYLVISKDPTRENTVTSVESVATFKMPFEAFFGLHMSQRTLGQDFAAEIADTSAPMSSPSDLTISTMSQATTTLTVTTATAHNLVPGMRISIYGCVDPRVNYPSLVVATIPSTTQFTATAGPGGTIPSLTIGPFTSGYVGIRKALGGAISGSSMIFENATATNASFYVRASSGDNFASGTVNGNQSVTVGTTASVQPVNTPYSYSFIPTTVYRLAAFPERLQWIDASANALTSLNARYTNDVGVPGDANTFKIRFRAENNRGMTRPVGRITAIAKSGTTTATVTTDVAHGLSVNDQVCIYGVRDQTNFANLTTATQVASIVSSTQFTIVLGAAVTATSYGGAVMRVNGGNLPSALGYITMSAQTAVLTAAGVLTLTGSATFSGPSVGDLIHLWGAVNSSGVSLGIDGAWRIRSIGASLELEPVGWSAPAAFGSTNCGGVVIKRTDLRVGFVRIFNALRERIEFTSRPAGDVGNAGQVQVANTVSVAQGTRDTLGAGWYVEPDNLLVADVASAALTTTTTTATITPVPVGGAAEFNIIVTAVSGTTPTLDVVVQESDDTGTNWYDIYHFPRITATGAYRSPVIPLTGNRLRYVQTVFGKTPSFTRAINRITHLMVSPPPFRQIINRTLDLTTVGAATASMSMNGAKNVSMVINCASGGTSYGRVALMASDDNGVTWYNIGTSVLPLAGGVSVLTFNNVTADLVRVQTNTASTGVTLNNIVLRAFG